MDEEVEGTFLSSEKLENSTGVGEGSNEETDSCKACKLTEGNKLILLSDSVVIKDSENVEKICCSLR